MRGSRVQAVVNELQGEKIDIIPWNDDQPTFLVNALQPAEVTKVVLDEEAGKIEVVVPDDQLSLPIFSFRRSIASPLPTSTITLPYSSRLTTPLIIVPARSLNSSNCRSRSASRTFCKITCLAD